MMVISSITNSICCRPGRTVVGGLAIDPGKFWEVCTEFVTWFNKFQSFPAKIDTGIGWVPFSLRQILDTSKVHWGFRYVKLSQKFIEALNMKNFKYLTTPWICNNTLVPFRDTLWDYLVWTFTKKIIEHRSISKVFYFLWFFNNSFLLRYLPFLHY